MTTTYVLVYQHTDRSGIQGIWGPYETEAAAAKAQLALSEWPLAAGSWETLPCREFQPAPKTTCRGDR